ncbi:hypothetical protein BLOT_002290, partial [Blomia tropicalis]
TRRSRSRTPARAATPQVKKIVAKPKPLKTKKSPKTPKSGRSKTPTRNATIMTSTPKPKTPRVKKVKASNSEEKPKRKRKSVSAMSDDELDDIINLVVDEDNSDSYPKTKKAKTPRSPSKAKRAPSKRLAAVAATAELDTTDSRKRRSSSTRRTRRVKSSDLNSILELSESKLSSKDLSARDLTSNGNVNLSRNDTLNDTQSNKWGWFSCAIIFQFYFIFYHEPQFILFNARRIECRAVLYSMHWYTCIPTLSFGLGRIESTDSRFTIRPVSQMVANCRTTVLLYHCYSCCLWFLHE